MMKVSNSAGSFRLSQNTVLLLFLIIFALISIASSSNVSLTLDEYLHYQYGMNILNGNSTRFDDSKMPISALNALPGRLASFLPEGLLKTVLARFAVARLVTIISSMFVAWLVFAWARSMYGFIPAMFSLLLYIFDPNIIAHSQLVTTDLYILGIICLTFYRLWLFANQRTLKNGLLFLLALGISQIVKYTAIALFPLCLLAMLLHDLPIFFSTAENLNLFSKKYAVYILSAIAATLLIINVGFLFNRTFTRLGDYKFRSAPFIALQKVSALQKIPAPVPYPYLEGLDWMLNTEQTGNRYGNLYLLGQIRKQGFPGYYFVAALFKVPLASQLIMAAAFIVYFSSTEKRRNFLHNEVFFFVPIAFFTIYFNFFFKTQIGIRYYLVMFPMLYIFAGSLFAGWERLSTARKTLGIMLASYLVVSVLACFPYYIPYFNELVWDKTQTYKYLSDSNLDWGQGQIYLEQYLSDHSNAIYAPTYLKTGTLIVGGSDLVGILEDPARYEWLRSNFEPEDTIANCYFVYEISEQEIDNLCASAGYCK